LGGIVHPLVFCTFAYGCLARSLNGDCWGYKWSSYDTSSCILHRLFSDKSSDDVVQKSVEVATLDQMVTASCSGYDPYLPSGIQKTV